MEAKNDMNSLLLSKWKQGFSCPAHSDFPVGPKILYLHIFRDTITISFFAKKRDIILSRNKS